MKVCDNCGAEIKGSEKFCGICGKRLEDKVTEKVSEITEDTKNEQVKEVSEEQENKSQETVSQKQNDEEAFTLEDEGKIKKKEKSSFVAFVKRHYIKLSVSLVVLIALIVGLVFAAPYISNSFNRLFMSSEDYFKHVVKENLKDDVDGIASLLGEIKENVIFDDKTSSGSIEIKTGEGLEDLIDGFGASYMYGDIEWIEELKLDLEMTSKDEVLGMFLALSANNQDIGALDSILDGRTAYISFPGINDEYIMNRLDENPFGTDEFKTMMEIMSAIPDEKVTSRIMNRYISVVVDNVGKVSETDTTVKADSISQKCVKLSTYIDSKVLQNAMIDVCESLKDDKDILNIIRQYCEESSSGLKYDKVYNEYLDALDQYIEELENLSDRDDGIGLDFYVNNKGEIIGWGIHGENAELESIFTLKGTKFGYALNFESENSEDLSFEGGGNIKENKLSGDFSLEADGVRVVDVAVKDLDIKKSSQGEFVGTVEIEVSDSVKPLIRFTEIPEIIADLKIVISSDLAEKDGGEIAISVYVDDELCISLNAGGTLSEAKDIEIPDDAYDSRRQYESEEWAKEFDFTKLINNLTKAGVPAKYILMLKNMFM